MLWVLSGVRCALGFFRVRVGSLLGVLGFIRVSLGSLGRAYR